MIVGQIPPGKIATYGQVARLAGIPRNARQVGSVLNSLPAGSDVPWYRVVNSRGEISARGNLASENTQREYLENENVVFDEKGRIAIDRYSWKP
jgi:methylated-DNA-protein-cysteine methyltransferase-like protein